MGRSLPPVTARSAGDNDRRSFIHITTREQGRPGFATFDLLCHIYPGVPHQCAARFSLCVLFAYKKIARPNWDANSWEDVLSVDTNSLRYLLRWSSKNCHLQFANSDIFKENYSIDNSVCQCTRARARTRTHTRLEHASFTHMTSL